MSVDLRLEKSGFGSREEDAQNVKNIYAPLVHKFSSPEFVERVVGRDNADVWAALIAVCISRDLEIEEEFTFDDLRNLLERDLKDLLEREGVDCHCVRDTLDGSRHRIHLRPKDSTKFW